MTGTDYLNAWRHEQQEDRILPADLDMAVFLATVPRLPLVDEAYANRVAGLTRHQWEQLAKKAAHRHATEAAISRGRTA